MPEIIEERYPWPAASATGAGSLPGTDPGEAARLVFGELPDLPHLAELPARGPGADLTGRTAALLVDLAVELAPTGWRLGGRPGRDLRRARDLLSTDLDVLEEVASGYRGSVKIQVCGPWTLAATVELPRSQDPALADAGAVADLIASLAEGVAAHVAEVGRRIPGARIVLQLDEPALPSVIAGTVPTASGLNRVPVPEAASIESGLSALISAASTATLVHCCGLSVPFGMIKAAGADGAGCDLSLLGRADEDALAEAVEAGLGIFAGVVPATGPEVAGTPGTGAERAGAGAGAEGTGGRAQRGGAGLQRAGAGARRAGAGAQRAGPGQALSPRRTAERVIELWRRLGWPVARAGAGTGARGGEGTGVAGGVSAQVVLTPACGLAGAGPGYARAAMACCREAARLLPELIEEGT